MDVRVARRAPLCRLTVEETFDPIKLSGTAESYAYKLYRVAVDRKSSKRIWSAMASHHLNLPNVYGYFYCVNTLVNMTA